MLTMVRHGERLWLFENGGEEDVSRREACGNRRNSADAADSSVLPARGRPDLVRPVDGGEQSDRAPPARGAESGSCAPQENQVRSGHAARPEKAADAGIDRS